MKFMLSVLILYKTLVYRDRNDNMSKKKAKKNNNPRPKAAGGGDVQRDVQDTDLGAKDLEKYCCIPVGKVIHHYYFNYFLILLLLDDKVHFVRYTLPHP